MIADSVKPCKCVYDTGSDHAFIPIYLMQNDICKKAIAADINRGPMDVAFKNIKKFDLIGQIALALCYGIENAAGCDCIIVAGMGGQLIVDILERHHSLAKDASQLVLQPMNAPEKIRKYLWDNGYNIYYENLCSEKHKVYNVICARYAGEKKPYEEFELHSSEYLVKTNHNLLKLYLEPKLRRLGDMVSGANDPNQKNSRLIEKLEALVK